MVLESRTVDPRLQSQHWLCRFDNHRPFANACGLDFIRASDETVWAHICDDWLVSAESGERIAYRRGTIYFDAATQQPLYYQRS